MYPPVVTDSVTKALFSARSLLAPSSPLCFKGNTKHAGAPLQVGTTVE
jgi:hypothetical protein